LGSNRYSIAILRGDLLKINIRKEIKFNQMVKILLVASIDRHFIHHYMHFINNLLLKKCEVHIATNFTYRKQILEGQGIICHQIDFSRSINLFHAFKSLLELVFLMKKNKFDLIHVNTPMAAFLGRIAAKITKTSPILYTAHGFHFYKGAPWYYWAFIYPAECLVARWTDGLIVINQEDYINAQRMGFKPNKNFFLVHGVGIDLKKIINVSYSNSGIREELDIKEKDIIISCVAEFTPNKNQMFLLRTWKKIVQEYNNIHLLFIGKGKSLNNLKKYVKHNSVSRVYFLGYRNDVPKILLKSDIVVLVSKREGLPRSIMEAMALGKPIIVSNVRGNRELVQHGENGYLVNLGDLDGLINYLQKLILDPRLREMMGKKSSEKIKLYDIRKIVSDLNNIYNNFLEEKI